MRSSTLGHIKNNVLDRFGEIVDLSDVVTASEEQQEKVRLTRSLAAFSIAEWGNVDGPDGAQMCYMRTVRTTASIR